jgi:GNAT superfamily N-acetyltransferase
MSSSKRDPLDPDTLLAAYDAQLRFIAPDPLPAGVSAELDGPLLRLVGLDGGGFLDYRDVSALAPDELDALIARQRDIFAARGEEVEWKYRSHDRPADLPDRLRAAGFEPQELETVVVGLVAHLAALDAPVPEGVRLRAATGRADLDRIAAMESTVWDEDRSWLADALDKELAADATQLDIVLAEHGDTVVSAGWLRYVPGTAFAGLWGGSTLAQFRGRGVYKALVNHRARLAARRGYTYLQVDASADSRPILLRLGFQAITTTTPYVWSPPRA